MDKLLKKIYDEVICYEEDVTKMNKTIEKESMDILKKHSNQFSTEEEKLLELLDDAASFAVREGFCMGMKYAFKIMTKIFKE